MILTRALILLFFLTTIVYVKFFHKRDQQRKKLAARWNDPNNDVMYVIGDPNFISNDEEADRYLLHVHEVLENVKPNELRVIEVKFPFNVRNIFSIKSVQKIL